MQCSRVLFSQTVLKNVRVSSGHLVANFHPLEALGALFLATDVLSSRLYNTRKEGGSSSRSRMCRNFK